MRVRVIEKEKKKRESQRLRRKRRERKEKKNYLSIFATVGCIYPYLL